MQLHHTTRLDHSADAVFAVVSDLRRLAACVPGATVDGGSANDCHGRVRIKAGPVLVAYEGDAHVVERDDDERRLVFAARARGDGPAGRLDVTFDVSVEAQREASVVTVDTDLALKGIAAQLGRGPTEAVADHLIRGLVDALDRQLAGPEEELGDATTPGAATTTAPTRGEADEPPPSEIGQPPLAVGPMLASLVRGSMVPAGVAAVAGGLLGALATRALMGGRRPVIVCCPCVEHGRDR